MISRRRPNPGIGSSGAGRPGPPGLVSPPAALVVGVAASLLVALVAALVWHTYRPDAVDAEMMRWQEAAGIRADGVATAIGNAVGPSAALAVLASAALAWRVKRWDAAVLAVIAVPGTVVIEQLLKELVHRQRPDGAALLFPSGHVAVATAAAVVTVLTLRAAGVRPRARARSAWPAVLLVLLVAAARLVQTVHYVTDVVGGAALGAAVTCWVALAITVSARGGVLSTDISSPRWLRGRRRRTHRPCSGRVERS